MRVRVLSRHEVPERPPIQLAVGEPVMVGEPDTEWPEFVFVTSATGSGWVPARHLSAAAGPAVVEIAYDTTELTVGADQQVTVVERDDTSGWWWCRDDAGSEGWVPMAVLEES